MLKYSKSGQALALALTKRVLCHFISAGFAPPMHSSYESDAHVIEEAAKTWANKNAEKYTTIILIIANNCRYNSHDAYIRDCHFRDDPKWQNEFKDISRTLLDDVLGKDQLSEPKITYFMNEIMDHFFMKIFIDDFDSISTLLMHLRDPTKRQRTV